MKPRDLPGLLDQLCSYMDQEYDASDARAQAVMSLTIQLQAGAVCKAWKDTRRSPAVPIQHDGERVQEATESVGRPGA